MCIRLGHAAASLETAASERLLPLPESLSPQVKRHVEWQNSAPAATMASRCELRPRLVRDWNSCM